MTKENMSEEPKLPMINYIGTYTLFKKEVDRFFKVYTQTVFAPVVTAVLYMIIFVGAIGLRDPYDVGGTLVSFSVFVLPGLAMMSLLNNAFQNTSSSLVIAKVQGSITDIIMPPLSAHEFTLAFIMGGVVRGLLVGFITALTIYLIIFTSEQVAFSHIWAIFYFSFSAALMFSLFGFITGLWAEKFDQMAAITNFLIAPLSMISGTFFPISRLPEYLHVFAIYNPVYHLMEGFRYGFIGHSDIPILVNVLSALVINIILYIIAYRLIKTGWKIKS